MRRFLLVILVVFSLTCNLFGQSYSNGTQEFKIVGIESDSYHTFVFIEVTTLKRGSGWFSFSAKNYLQCGEHKLYLDYYTVSGQGFFPQYDYPPPHYGRGPAGRLFSCKLQFPRIPYDVSSVEYVSPGHWKYTIPITDNADPVSHSEWTISSLKKHFDSAKSLNSIEGIYNLSYSDYSEMPSSIGLVKSESGYDLVFLESNTPMQLLYWKEGDLKATVHATSIKGRFNVTNWYDVRKSSRDNFFAQYGGGTLAFEKPISEKTSMKTLFIKSYPPFDNQSSSPGAEIEGNQEESFSASGTGFFIDSRGYIATNYHVIDGAQSISVILNRDGKATTYQAKPIVVDKMNDLAIIKMDDGFKVLSPIPYVVGSGTKDVGTSVFAMGYPELSFLGEEIKVTDGIISSKTGFQGDVTTYQISAPIQHGNSGGPLFDKNGNLIGITNAGVTELQNVGYAIKVSYLNNLIESCSERIMLPTVNKLNGKTFTEQIKQISPYIVIIKIK